MVTKIKPKKKIIRVTRPKQTPNIIKKWGSLNT